MERHHDTKWFLMQRGPNEWFRGGARCAWVMSLFDLRIYFTHVSVSASESYNLRETMRTITACRIVRSSSLWFCIVWCGFVSCSVASCRVVCFCVVSRHATLCRVVVPYRMDGFPNFDTCVCTLHRARRTSSTAHACILRNSNARLVLCGCWLSVCRLPLMISCVPRGVRVYDDAVCICCRDR